MSNAGYWNVDPIHNGLAGAAFLAYVAAPKDSTSGVYVRIETDGTLDIGDFNSAVPHMGEAEYFPKVHEKFDNMNFAFSQACETYKLTFLKELRRGKPPFRSTVAKFL